MPDRPKYSLGDAGALAFELAMQDWKLQHAPSTPVNDLLAFHLDLVEVQTQVRPGGRATITVTLHARLSSLTEVSFFRLLRLNGLWEFEDDRQFNPQP